MKKILLISYIIFLGACSVSSDSKHEKKGCKIIEIYQEETTNRNPLIIGFNFICNDSISIKKIYLKNNQKIYDNLELPKINNNTKYLNFDLYYKEKKDLGLEIFDIEEIPIEEIEQKTKIKIPKGESRYLTHVIGRNKGEIHFSKYLTLQSYLLISGFKDTTDFKTKGSIAYNGQLNIINSNGNSVLNLQGNNSIYNRILIDTSSNLVGIQESGIKELNKVESKLMVFDLQTKKKLFSKNMLVKKEKIYQNQYFYYEVIGSSGKIIDIILFDLKHKRAKNYPIPEDKNISGGRIKNNKLILYEIEYDQKILWDTIRIDELLEMK